MLDAAYIMKCILPENDDSFDIWHMLLRHHEPLDDYQGWTRQGRWNISLESVSDMESKILLLYLSIFFFLWSWCSTAEM